MDIFWQITIVEFLLNVAVFAGAVMAYGPILRGAGRLGGSSRTLIEGATVGTLFGASTGIALLMPIHMNGGTAVGGQMVLLVLAALMGGYMAALGAAVVSLLIVAYLWTGGAALGMAALVSAGMSIALGCALRFLLDRRRNANVFGYVHLPLVGVLSAIGPLVQLE